MNKRLFAAKSYASEARVTLLSIQYQLSAVMAKNEISFSLLASVLSAWCMPCQ